MSPLLFERRRMMDEISRIVSVTINKIRTSNRLMNAFRTKFRQRELIKCLDTVRIRRFFDDNSFPGGYWWSNVCCFSEEKKKKKYRYDCLIFFPLILRGCGLIEYEDVPFKWYLRGSCCFLCGKNFSPFFFSHFFSSIAYY